LIKGGAFCPNVNMEINNHFAYLLSKKL